MKKLFFDKSGNLNIILIFAIFIVAIAGLLPVLFTGIKAKNGGNNKESEMVCDQFISVLDTISYYSMELFDDGDTTDLNDISNPDHAKVVDLGNRSFNILWNVADNTPEQFMKTINVIVKPVKSENIFSKTITRQKDN